MKRYKKIFIIIIILIGFIQLKAFSESINTHNLMPFSEFSKDIENTPSIILNDSSTLYKHKVILRVLSMYGMELTENSINNFLNKTSKHGISLFADNSVFKGDDYFSFLLDLPMQEKALIKYYVKRVEDKNIVSVVIENKKYENDSFIGNYFPLGKIDFKTTQTSTRDKNISKYQAEFHALHKKTLEIEKVKIDAFPASKNIFKYYEKTGLSQQIIKAIDKYLESIGEENIFYIEHNELNICGIGEKNILGISRTLQNDSIALFHELAHGAIDAGFLSVEDLFDLIPFNSVIRERFFDFSNNQTHDFLRFFQNFMWPEQDKRLTQKIKFYNILTSYSYNTNQRSLEKSGKVKKYVYNYGKEKFELSSEIELEQIDTEKGLVKIYSEGEEGNFVVIEDVDPNQCISILGIRTCVGCGFKAKINGKQVLGAAHLACTGSNGDIKRFSLQADKFLEYLVSLGAQEIEFGIYYSDDKNKQNNPKRIEAINNFIYKLSNSFEGSNINVKIDSDEDFSAVVVSRYMWGIERGLSDNSNLFFWTADENPEIVSDGEYSYIGFMGNYSSLEEIQFLPFDDQRVGNKSKAEYKAEFKAINTKNQEIKRVKLYGSLLSKEGLNNYKKQGLSLEIIEALDRYIARLDKNKMFLIEPNEFGINGIATKNMLVIAKPFKSNELALFHELAHGAIDQGLLSEEMLLRVINKTEIALENIDPKQKSHYLLRYIQKCLWPEQDSELTKRIQFSDAATRRYQKIQKTANDLCIYIDRLRMDAQSGETIHLFDMFLEISLEKDAYEVYTPLFNLLFEYLQEDFQGSEEFIEKCKDELFKKGGDELTNGPSDLRAKLKENKEFLESFKKINKAKGYKDLNLSFYGILFYFLSRGHEGYISHLYDVFYADFPENISLLKKGFSYHVRSDCVKHNTLKSVIYTNKESKYLNRVIAFSDEKKPADDRKEKYTEEQKEELSFKDYDFSNKVEEALVFWEENFPEEEREYINFFKDNITVVALKDLQTYNIFFDPDTNVLRPLEIDKHNDAVFFTEKFLKQVDDPRELLLWLRFVAKFLYSYEQMREKGKVKMKTLYKIASRMLTDEEVCWREYIHNYKQKLYEMAKEDTVYLFSGKMNKIISQRSDIEDVLGEVIEKELIKDELEELSNIQRDKLKDFYIEQKETAKNILYYYESMGLEKWAQKAYDAYRKAIKKIQYYDDGGHGPLEVQIELVFTSFRLCRYSKAIDELKTLYTGKGFPRKLKRSELNDLEDNYLGKVNDKGLTIARELDNLLQDHKEFVEGKHAEDLSGVSEDVNKVLTVYDENGFTKLEYKNIDEKIRGNNCIQLRIDKEGYIFNDIFNYKGSENRIKFYVGKQFAFKTVLIFPYAHNSWETGINVFLGGSRIASYYEEYIAEDLTESREKDFVYKIRNFGQKVFEEKDIIIEENPNKDMMISFLLNKLEEFDADNFFENIAQWRGVSRNEKILALDLSWIPQEQWMLNEFSTLREKLESIEGLNIIVERNIERLITRTCEMNSRFYQSNDFSNVTIIGEKTICAKGGLMDEFRRPFAKGASFVHIDLSNVKNELKYMDIDILDLLGLLMHKSVLLKHLKEIEVVLPLAKTYSLNKLSQIYEKRVKELMTRA